MNYKNKLAVSSAFFAFVLLGASPLYASTNSSNMSNMHTSMMPWYEFDEANNGESYSWEGEPMFISLGEYNNDFESMNQNQMRGGWQMKWRQNGGQSNNHNDSHSQQKWNKSSSWDDEDSDDEDNEDSNDEFDVQLSGDQEVPGPGDDEGEGTANVRLHPDHGLVCVDIEVSGITLPATAAHIHKASVDQAGPVVLGLAAPNEDGDSYGCVSADKAAIQDMMDHPENYYVNVHNKDYPDGALRGQLSD